MPRSVMAAVTGKHNTVFCHLRGPGKATSSSRAVGQRSPAPCRAWGGQGTWLAALGATCVTAFPLLAAVWCPGGKRHLGMLQPCLSGASPLRSAGVLPLHRAITVLQGLLPLPIPLVPSKAHLQMKPAFSPHVFSHCSNASFPSQSFGNSSCPPQLRPFFPLSLRQAAKYASKAWSLTEP